MIRFTCPRCGTSLSAPLDCAGRTSRCRCGQQLVGPQAPSAAPQSTTPPDKTALGQVVAHTPTNLPRQPGRERLPAAPPPGQGRTAPPPSTPDKTALGQAISHRPTRVKQGVGG